MRGVFLEELSHRCELCFAAVSDLNAAVASKGGRDLFRPATEFICQAAMISKILWPPGNRDRKVRDRAIRRGEALRAALEIEGDHPIKDRTLRDHFEHYDERLDAWAEESRNKNIVRKMVGPRSAVGGDAIGDGDIIEHYDPATKKLAFRGEHFDMQVLADTVQDIYKRTQALLAKKHRA